MISPEPRRSGRPCPGPYPSDDELMRRVQAGAAEAFSLIVQRHRARLVRAAARALHRKDTADDVTQEAFLCLLEARHRYEPRGKLGAYLNQVLRNQCRMENRRRDLGLERQRADAAPDELTTPAPYEHELLLASLEALSSLAEGLRTIVELRHGVGLSFAEIAARLGAPEGTVRRRHFDAMRRLQRAMAAE